MKNSNPPRESLETEYTLRYNSVLKPLASALAAHLTDCFKDEPRIDRITARPKAVDRFLEKARTKIDGKPKYSEPLWQIQDQLGARVITFYNSDVERLDAVVNKFFRSIEFKDHIPESESEFGYISRHYVLVIPSDIIDAHLDKNLIPEFFELQIKTLFQHAWSESEHDLGYKPGFKPLTSSEKRRLAFTAAQAWGADHIFDELFKERQFVS